ncbi:MAG: hypothetical protein D9V47_11705 [Clostridia bacterium]|nr:MAG: hypothetical protein D9V47_11705 [Clostridia bacterium]
MSLVRRVALFLLVMFLLTFTHEQAGPVLPGNHSSGTAGRPPDQEERFSGGSGGSSSGPGSGSVGSASPETGGGSGGAVTREPGADRKTAPTEGRVPGELVVGYRDGHTRVVRVPGGKEEKAARNLAADPEVKYVEPNYRVHMQAVAEAAGPSPAVSQDAAGPVPGNGSYFSQQTYLAQMGLVAASAQGLVQKRRQVTVAVVDTGVEATHPALRGRVAPGGWDFVDGDDNPADTNGHGTHVASIVAAAPDNGQGITGTALDTDTRILPVRVLDGNGDGDTYTVARGVTYAADHGADIILLSLGSPVDSQVMHQAITHARQQGALILAAAGNGGRSISNYFPAAYSEVLAVSAVDAEGKLAWFSNYGPQVSLAAPGVGIWGAVPRGKYEKRSGTSAAAALAAGVAAVVWSTFPDFTAAEVSELLKNTARDLPPVGFDYASGYGLVDALAALRSPGGGAMRLLVPAEGEVVWGVVRVTIRAARPAGQVAVFLNGTELGRAYRSGDGNDYIYQWDTRRTADGTYRLEARAGSGGGEEVVAAIHVQVRNRHASGLDLTVNDPQGVPLPGALVTVLFRAREAGEEYTEHVFTGRTGTEGRIHIPGSLARSGETYLVLVSGSLAAGSIEMPVFYQRLLTAPRETVIDGRQARLVSLAAEQLNGAYLDHAYVMIDPVDPGSGEPIGWPSFLGILDERGRSMALVDMGTYNLEAVSWQYNYYLRSKDFAVGEGSNRLNFSDQPMGRLRLNLVGLTPNYAFIYPYQKGMLWSWGFDLTGDRSLVITSGEYYLGAKIGMQKDGEQWFYWLEANSPLAIAAGRVAAFSLGGPLWGRVIPDQDTYRVGDTVKLQTGFTDAFGNRIWEAGLDREKIQENISGQGLAQPQGQRLGVVFSPALGQSVPWRPASYQALVPVLEVTTGDGRVVFRQEGAEYYHQGFYQVPQDTVSGKYLARLTLDFGPWQGKVQATSPEITLQSRLADGIHLLVLDPEEKPAAGAQVSFWQVKGQGMTQAYASRTDASGWLYISPQDLPAEGSYRVIASFTADTSGEQVGVLLNRELTFHAGPNLLRAAEARPVVVKAAGQDGTGLAFAEVFASPLDRGGTIVGDSLAIGSLKANGETLVWVDPGRYYFQAVSWYPAYYLTLPETTIVPGGQAQYLDFNGREVARLRVKLASQDFTAAAVQLVTDRSSFFPIFQLLPDQEILVTPGAYRPRALLERRGDEGSWEYWLEADVPLSLRSGTRAEYSVGGPWHVSLKVDKESYRPGERVEAAPWIGDDQGNRLVNIWSLHGDAEVLGLIQAQELGADQEPPPDIPGYQLVAPVVGLVGPSGETIASRREAADFYAISWPLPATLPAGDYALTLTLGLDGGQGVVTYTGKAGFRVGGEAMVPPREPVPRSQETAREIGPRGGELRAGDFRLEILPRAVEQLTTFTAVAVPGPNFSLDGYRLTGDPWHVTPEDIYLRRPARITLPFAPGPADPQELGVYRYDPGTRTWIYLGGQVQGEGKIVAQTDRLGSFVVAEKVVAFTDLKGHWAQKEAEVAAARGIMAGYPDGSFRPDAPLTRAEWVKTLAEALHLVLPAGPEPAFTDVPVDSWYAPYIRAARDAGWVKGYGDHFAPDAPITREEALLMLVRALGVANEANDLPPEKMETMLSRFQDSSQVSSWAKGAMSWAVSNNWLRGVGQNDISPRSPTTRGQAATLLARVWLGIS